MSTVFISYRRQSASGEARSLSQDLVERLGRKAVFMDVDSISPGRDFRREIHKTLGVCDLMLVLIDSDWLAAKDDKGQLRLQNPGDYVRTEIETALKRDIPVTPVLIKGARLPAVSDLPAEISDLVYRGAVQLRHESWEADVGEMIRRLELTPAEGFLSQRWRIGLPVVAVVVAVLGYLAFTLLPRQGPPAASRTEVAPSPRAEPAVPPRAEPAPSQRAEPAAQPRVDSAPPACDLTGDWSNKGERFALTQTGASVAFRYDTPTVNHFGSGLYDKDGRQVVLNLTRVLKSGGCRLSGTATLEVVTCSQLRSTTSWEPGCDLPQGISDDLGMSHRAQ